MNERKAGGELGNRSNIIENRENLINKCNCAQKNDYFSLKFKMFIFSGVLLFADK